MANEDLIKERYKFLPVRGKDIGKILAFLKSTEIDEKITPVNIYSEGISAVAAKSRYVQMITPLLDRYNEYKNKGYIKDAEQRIPLGQLTDDPEVILAYVTALQWKSMPEPNEATPTRGNIYELVNSWISFHRARIGMDLQSPRYLQKFKLETIETYLDPTVAKATKANPAKYSRKKTIKEFSISIAEAESTLLDLLKEYENDNDIVMLDERGREAYEILRIISGQVTALNKTTQGVINEGMKIYNNINANRLYNNRSSAKKNPETREEFQQAYDDSIKALEALLKQKDSELDARKSLQRQIQALQQQLNNSTP